MFAMQFNSVVNAEVSFMAAFLGIQQISQQQSKLKVNVFIAMCLVRCYVILCVRACLYTTLPNIQSTALSSAVALPNAVSTHC